MSSTLDKETIRLALRSYWTRLAKQTSDYANIVDLLSLICGLRPGVLLRGDRSLHDMIHYRLKCLVTGIYLRSVSMDGHIYVSSEEIGTVELADATKIGEKLGYVYPMSVSSLMMYAKDNYRIRFSMRAVFDGEFSVEPWVEVIPAHESHKCCSLLLEKLQSADVLFYTNMLDLISRGSHTLKYVNFSLKLVLPDKKTVQWISINVYPKSADVDAQIDISVNHTDFSMGLPVLEGSTWGHMSFAKPVYSASSD